MTPETAEWIRNHAWPERLRRDYQTMPETTHLCACQRSLCGHCSAGRCHTCTHERHPPTRAPETWLLGSGARYERVWLADRVCTWTCPCRAGHTTQLALV